jgi:hypothetical protein
MPNCPQLDRIILEWREAVAQFTEEVKLLAECTGNRDAFLIQFHNTDLARQHCEDARTALELHRAEHNCW